MKKLFKVVACVAVACALLSTSAFAALTLTGSVNDTGNGTYSVSVSGLGEGESTILVYKSKSDTEIKELPATINEADIVYIDQQTASGGTASYTVDVGSRAQAGDTLYFFAGGTNNTGSAVLLRSEPISVPVTGVNLAPKALSLTVGGTETLVATVEPADATNKAVTWSSNNPAVATVSDEGFVTAVAAGDAIITVTSNADNTKTATCTVTVSNPVIAVTVNSTIIASDGNSTAFIGATGRDFGSAFRIKFTTPGTSIDGGVVFGLSTSDGKRYLPKQTLLEGVAPNSAVTLDVSFLNGSTVITPLEISGVSVILSDGNDNFFYSDETDANHKAQ